MCIRDRRSTVPADPTGSPKASDVSRTRRPGSTPRSRARVASSSTSWPAESNASRADPGSATALGVP
eukprot:5389763-Alexandrium_andersonii.AAC.1